MTPETKAKLTEAFEKVGPEFIERALRVREWGDNPFDERDTACRCFVGYGQATSQNPQRAEFIFGWIDANKKYGRAVVDVLHAAYEYDGTKRICTKEELFTLAEEWLEQNRTKVEVCTLTLQG